jgi:hypothetical protein
MEGAKASRSALDEASTHRCKAGPSVDSPEKDAEDGRLVGMESTILNTLYISSRMIGSR